MNPDRVANLLMSYRNLPPGPSVDTAGKGNTKLLEVVPGKAGLGANVVANVSDE